MDYYNLDFYQIRKQSGMTVKEVSKKTGKSVQYLNKVEQKKIEKVSPKVLKYYLKLLNGK